MEFASAYTKRIRVHPPLGGESMTKQSFAEESEINNILKKYERTGIIKHAEGSHYSDLPSDLDYHNAMNMVLAAQESFEALPALARREFNNDPHAFLTFIDNPENVDRMVELGLINEPVKAPAEPSEPAPAAADPAAA